MTTRYQEMLGGGGVRGVALHLSIEDLDEGGEVQMPLEPVFWSPLFGACVDRFGVSWMLSGGADEMPGG